MKDLPGDLVSRFLMRIFCCLFATLADRLAKRQEQVVHVAPHPRGRQPRRR